ncbi:hypothetical protein [Streptomyces sp. NPDC000410]|uniref:hypothetical protein n=1 Tax=Streptomyces sp. NPDC000410 TaxID=3154254 RepID=UPI003318D8BB
MLTVVDTDGSTRDGSMLDEIVREGARRMPAAALEAEVSACIAELAHERDESERCPVARWRAVDGSRLVPLVRAGVRFGHGLLVERSGVIAA